MGRWPNFYLPAIVAVIAARVFYVYVSKLTAPNVTIVLIASIVLVPVFFYFAVFAVGFVFGLIGIDPVEQTSAFNTGWSAGARLTGRKGRWH
jgi:hypothetical protein